MKNQEIRAWFGENVPSLTLEGGVEAHTVWSLTVEHMMLRR